MRFAGSLTIALAALIYLPCQSRGDEPASESAVVPAKAQQSEGTPSFTPPDEVEGAWVSDPQPGNFVPGPAKPRRTVPLPMMPPGMARPGMAPPMAPQSMAPQGMMPPGMAPPMYDQQAEQASYMYGGYPEEYSGVNLTGEGTEYAGCSSGGGEGGGEFSGECCGGCQSGSHCGKCGCCGSDGPCGVLWNDVHSHHRLWLREEYIYWQTKGNPIPSLVTTSPVGTPQEEAGVLGLPTTTTLFGDRRYNNDYRNGGRITAGMWLVDGEFLGIEGHYFALEQSDRNFFRAGEFSQGGNGPILARPFFDVLLGTQGSSLIAFPNFNEGNVVTDIDGQIRVQTKSTVQSAGTLLRKLLWIEFTQNWRIDGLAGYRFFRLDDGVAIADDSTVVGGLLGDIRTQSYDYFQAKNQFNGGELGLVGSIHRGRWSLELLGKIGLGNTHQEVRISGTSFVSVSGSPPVETGRYRLLTQPSNDGVYRRDVFAVLPETNLNLRYDLSKNIRLIAGYNFIYLSQVQRSGSAIDLNLVIDPTGPQPPGATQPAFHFKNEGYWMHGLNAGVEFRF